MPQQNCIRPSAAANGLALAAALLGLDVRRRGDGCLQPRGSGLAQGPAAESGRRSAQHLVRHRDGRVSGGSVHRRRAVRLAGRPHRPRACDDAQRAHVRRVHRPLRAGQQPVAVGRAAVHCGAGHGRRMVAGRGAGDGGLAESLARVHGRTDRRGRQRRLPDRRRDRTDAEPGPGRPVRHALRSRSRARNGRLAHQSSGLADHDDSRRGARSADVPHPDLRAGVGALAARAAAGSHVALADIRLAGCAGGNRGARADDLSLGLSAYGLERVPVRTHVAVARGGHDRRARDRHAGVHLSRSSVTCGVRARRKAPTI